MILEICTASVDDSLAAQQGGADRIELNAGLQLGGLTPSMGTLRATRESIDLPIIVMIRPRPGGFCYSPNEFDTMQRDIDLALAHGANGIAFGILTKEGQVDLERCSAVTRQAGTKTCVFHRAFDVVPNPGSALEQLIELGIDRVMTSGQEASAPEGATHIATYIHQARGRIEVLPAGGINQSTVAHVLARTGCNQVHASLSILKTDPSVLARPRVRFGSTSTTRENQFKATSPEAVSEMRMLLDTLSSR